MPFVVRAVATCNGCNQRLEFDATANEIVNDFRGTSPHGWFRDVNSKGFIACSKVCADKLVQDGRSQGMQPW